MATDVASLKAALDGLLGGRVHRDGAPSGTVLPYVTIHDDVSRAPLLNGDGRALAWRKLVQVDLWQDAASESDTLTDNVIEALNGVACATGRAKVEGVQRLTESDTRIVHHALTLAIGSRART